MDVILLLLRDGSSWRRVPTNKLCRIMLWEISVCASIVSFSANAMFAPLTFKLLGLIFTRY